MLGKTMGRSRELADRFEGDSLRLADLEIRQRMAGRWVMSSIQMTFSILPAAVYWFGGWCSRGNTAITIGTLVAFTTLQTRLLFPIGSLLGVQLDVQTSLALFDRIFEYLDQPVDIEEKPGRDHRRPGRRRGLRPGLVPVRRSRLDARGRQLHRAGRTTTALVGETGSGKTTLGYLAARLYDVEEGSVTIGGVDIRDLSFEALSDLVGVVSQETYLFHASVRENLSFAKPDATDEEIEAAAEAARIHHVIADAARGLRHGGRRARLPVLRRREAAHRDRAHDPAQPAGPRARRGDELLDTETERLVQEALDRLSEGRTTIAIAHRLSTVRDADQIVVLDHGRIVETGRHEDLILGGGRYTALVSATPIWP